MIIHCTKKLAKKLPEVSGTALTEANPVGSWHANLYEFDGKECILLCHDKTRFVLFMAGLESDHFKNLGYWFEDMFANTLLKLDYDTDLIEKALGLLTPVQFDTACDRSVQGSMRTVSSTELIIELNKVSDVMELPLYSTSAKLNERPVSVKGMKSGQAIWPIKDMKLWLETVTGGGMH